MLSAGGDRVWAFADKGVSNLVERLDLIYHFIFDDNENPKHCQIYPDARNLGVTLTWTWLLDFKLEIAAGGDEQFPGSVIGKRHSYAFGKLINEYALVQVINGAGERIEPAWSKFVEYQKSKAAGETPGEIFYHEIE